MSVRQLLDTIDKSLVLELYKWGADDKPEHAGTYNLDVGHSLESLLSQYGDAQVMRSDKYKAYVLVYLQK